MLLSGQRRTKPCRGPRAAASQAPAPAPAPGLAARPRRPVADAMATTALVAGEDRGAGAGAHMCGDSRYT